MIFYPTMADVKDALMLMLCAGRVRDVTKLRAAEDDAELLAEQREYRREAKQRSRLKGKQ